MVWLLACNHQNPNKQTCQIQRYTTMASYGQIAKMVVVVVLMYELIDAHPIYDHPNTKLQKLQLSLEVATSVLKYKYFDGILKDCDKTSFFEISKVFVGLASSSQNQHIQLETIKNLQEKAIKAMIEKCSEYQLSSLNSYQLALILQTQAQVESLNITVPSNVNPCHWIQCHIQCDITVEQNVKDYILAYHRPRCPSISPADC